MPLVVIVNKSTAGAAEIVAGAILDNARGDVLGDKTFGAGSIQKTIDLQDGGALVLSIAKYYTPGGKAIQDVAITPNVLVADKADDFIAPEDSDITPDENEKPEPPKDQPDEQLRRAIEQLNKQESESCRGRRLARSLQTSAPAAPARCWGFSFPRLTVWRKAKAVDLLHGS